MTDKSIRLIARSYGWAIGLLAVLSVVGALSTYASLEEQAGHVEFSLKAHRQAQLFVSVQSAIIGVLENAKRETVDDAKFARVQRNLSAKVEEFLATNDEILAVLDGERSYWRSRIPDEVRAIYVEEPYRLAHWMGQVAGRGQIMSRLTRAELIQNDNNWTPFDVAMSGGLSLKGFDLAARAVERASVRSAERMERFHVAVAVAAILVILAEAAFIFGPLIARVKRERLRAEEALQEVRTIAYRDGLTGLANRVAFHEALAAACASHHRGEGFAVLLCDLDRFKSVNDGFGHIAGDRLLAEVARRLAVSVGSGGLVARLGGDEFAVLAHEVASPVELLSLVTRLRRDGTFVWNCEGVHLDVSLSVGGAHCPIHSDEPDRILAYADRALYTAKQSGFRAGIFDHDQRSKSDADTALLRALPLAFALREFEAHYQPKIRAADGSIAGLEALVRWRHPDAGLLAPGAFLPVVERGGHMVELSRTVVDLVAADLDRWRRRGAEISHVAINMPESMLSSSLGLDCLTAAIERHGLDPRMFAIEITEDVFVSRAAAAIQASVERISELGVKVSFDDFGTGYASLSHLRHFRFDELKIDRSFVADIGRSSMGEQIVRSMVSLGRALDKDVVAEGVETEEQLRFLTAEGCTLVQGFLFAPPMPAEEVEDWIRRRQGGFRGGAVPVQRHLSA